MARSAGVAVKALNKVDLPTFGNPTIPQASPMIRAGESSFPSAPP
jgi:hypothetical protein